MRFATKQKEMIKTLQSSEFQEREDAVSTVPSLPFLLDINRLGLITTNSQEGIVQEGYNPDSKKYYRIEERSYLEGIMKSEKANAFVTKINETTDKVAFIVRNEICKEYKKLYDENKNPKIPLTISGSSTTKNGKKEMKYFTSMPLAIPDEYMQKDFKDISEKVNLVFIFDPKYGRKATLKSGLYTAVINTLKAI